MKNEKITITETLVRQLLTTQFPIWKDLRICQIIPGGWDNRTFRLGDRMLVRMPTTAEYALQVEKEQYWLPKLAPLLPLAIPTPIAAGKPGEGYPCKWSIYSWLEGETATVAPIDNLQLFAKNLAEFLIALQSIDSKGGPIPGLHSFYRGGDLSIYDAETREAIRVLKNKIDTNAVIQIWETALTSHWSRQPVWVHGDLSAGNLLVQNGQLVAVIDFGQMTIGDPACDLAVTWTLFKNESRKIFKSTLSLDKDTWARARGWTMWKALIVAAGFTNPNNLEAKQSKRIIDEVIADYKQENPTNYTFES